MQASIRDEVRQRAGNRCEYCRLRQEHDRFHHFHVEHVIPLKHRGTDDLDNLALACQQCNLHKGTNLTGRDPDTNEVTRLFDPRKDHWKEHFTLEGTRIAGISAVGRTTAWVLEMNSDERVDLRAVLLELGELD
jgi:hypothetical protein